MLSAILCTQGEDLVLDQIQVPDRLEYGQVLVRIAYSGICGSQVGEIDGVKGKDAYLPHLLGHEGGGRVEKVGPGVRTVEEGDHVVLHWRPGEGIEAPLPQYQWGDKTVNAGWVTTFNELSVVSENRISKIPKHVPLDLAALFGCAVTTGLGVVCRDAKLGIGESLVVVGAGGVGLNVIQGASLVSAYPIVALDIFPEKLELAKKMGATHVLDSRSPDIAEQVKAIVGSKGADCVVDNTGRIPLMEMAYELTHPKGRTVLVGVTRHDEKPSFYSLPLHFGKRLIGSHGGDARPQEDIPRYLRMHELGKLQLEPLITHRMHLTEVNEALDLLRQGKVGGRCILEVNPF